MAHYIRQKGGGMQYPVFRGSAVQYGNGIGDIFKAIGRFLIPILGGSAATFLNTAASGFLEGQPLKESIKGAIGPTMSKAFYSTAEQVKKRISPQEGSGSRKRRRVGGQTKGARKATKRVYKGAYGGSSAKKARITKLASLNF